MQVNVQRVAGVQTTVYPVGHLLNDSMQAVIPALFPILETSMNLSYTQIGRIAFTLNMTSSVMQPVVGLFTDRTPSPYFLPLGMAASLLGMIGLAFAPHFFFVLLSIHLFQNQTSLLQSHQLQVHLSHLGLLLPLKYPLFFILSVFKKL
ncbi:hypothetical protein A7K69_07780 [Parageobacillus thermoglucosidasius]|jgi:MFS transporter, FSR family, fosmidomycin resistance protein|uniref:Uncharacterized protein n=1 Tax=Parageobacillus thermoglucosidasius TaxID=1426 RepID=A0A1B7KRV9_PARTM|nr:hypothetical protein A7K69_07780 [Parageobacillus thermoglucosidasius]